MSAKRSQAAVAATALLVLAGLPASAAAQTVPRLTGTGEPAVNAWSQRHLVQEDWTQVGFNGATVWFVSSLPVEAEGPASVRDWVRTEYGDAGNHGSLSGLTHVEVDCRNQRSRVLEFYHYRENNLRGDVLISDTPTSAMQAAKPGSIIQSYVEAICRGVR